MLDAGYPFAHRHQRGVLVPGTGRIPCRPGPAGQVATSGKRLGMLSAQDALADRHQRGQLIPGPGRIPRLPRPAGQVATSGKRLAGLSSRAVKYAMSSTTPSARVTACSAAATNDRPSGYRRNSDV